MAKKNNSGALSAAAATLGKRGGPARANVLSATQRSEIASKGGKAQKKGTAFQRGGAARGAAAKGSKKKG